MENINFILCIVYFGLGLLNILGIINLNESQVFAMTVGTLFLCLAPLFKKKNDRVFMYIIAAFFYIGFPLIIDAEKLIKDVDSNTWLLFSVAVTFLSNFINNNRTRKSEANQKNKELKDMLSKLSLLCSELLESKKDNKEK